MKATVKLFKSDGKNTEGLYPVKLTITHKGKPKRKTIGHSIESEWNTLKELPLQHHIDFDDLYPKIQNIRNKAQKSAFKVLNSFDDAFNFLLDHKKNELDFFSFAEERIKTMQKLGRHGNADAYTSALKDFKNFVGKNLYFNEIDSSLIQRYKEWKKIQKVGNSLNNVKNTTIVNYISEIRAIYNKCWQLHGLQDNQPFKGIFSDVFVRKRRARNVYIDKEGIKKLENASGFHKKQTQRTVDLALLQFYLGGQDMSDIYYLKKLNIQNDRVFFKRSKLGEKGEEFDVKLFEKAKKIIDKYSNLKNDPFLFPWRKDRTGYKTFLRTYNRSLNHIIEKLEIKVLPKVESFTSKCIRHSFATIAKFQHIDPDIIRELMGHERNDIDTIYKDKYPEDIRDEAHWQIITTDF